MLKALADTLEAAAEENEPTWLALPASWLQGMANLRLIHVLRRSIPVELSEGWIVFFCKRGKQHHNRSGFYWGVPSETASGYKWTDKFLAEHDQRRNSTQGKPMMGMIFRTDTYEYLSAKTVNALTMDSVKGVVENPERLSTYCWRRMLSTVALNLNFSPTERLALGDWKDTRAVGNEAPITLRYAAGKQGISKTCKLICAAVLADMYRKDTQSFEEITARQWESMAKEARDKVEAKTLEVNATWRNPDISKPDVGFKMKKSQVNFPKQLNGVPLAPASRKGERYCADFQAGTCKEGDDCQFGLHRCAAVFRGGRTCHGRHPGSECRNTKRHMASEESNPVRDKSQKRKITLKPRDEPNAKRAKTSNKAVHAAEDEPNAKRAKTSVHAAEETSRPGYVRDDSIMQKMLPELRRGRYRKRGNRLHPEPPRLVAKVCEEEGRGEFWLGPLPTASRMDQIKETNPSIQIYCFKNDPPDVQVQAVGESGMIIPGTVVFRCEMSNPNERLSEAQLARTHLVNSLRQGDNAFIHCISGISRAPLCAAVMSAILMGISLERAKNIVGQVRNVRDETNMEGPWIDQMLRSSPTEAEVPTSFSCRSARPCDVIVHATTAVKGGVQPICRWKKGAVGKHAFKGNILTRGSVEQASRDFAGKFCENCEPLLRASLRMEVDWFYGPY
jgi:hypothetical protein